MSETFSFQTYEGALCSHVGCSKPATSVTIFPMEGDGLPWCDDHKPVKPVGAATWNAPVSLPSSPETETRDA